jgi:hypothetical protein
MRTLLCILVLGLGLLCARPTTAIASTDTWPRALALMAEEQFAAALPLLERLVSEYPNNKNFRFELAVALFHLERDFRAKWHLEQARGARLTAAEARVVERFLAQIAARSDWTASFTIALKPESNASQKTSAETVSLGGLDFTLLPDARAAPGTSVLVTAGLEYSPRITESWKARFSLNTHLRYNERDSLRDYQLTGRAGLQYTPHARSATSGGIQYGHRWVGDTPYSRTNGVWAEHARLIGARGQLHVGLDLGRIHSDVALPRGRRDLLTASYAHIVSSNARVTLSGYFEHTSGSLPNLVGTKKGLNVAVLYAWQGGLMTSLQLGQHFDDRAGPEPLFGMTREDTRTSLSATIYHRDLSLSGFAPTLVLGIEENRSNIPLARYDNQFLSIGLTRNF